jgi:hypothetical protein
MKHLRLSIAGIMMLVALIGVGFAGLRASTPLWAAGLFTAAVALFTAAALGAYATRGLPWAGLALFGWAYLGVVYGPWPHNHERMPPLLTAVLLDRAQDRFLSQGVAGYYASSYRDDEPVQWVFRGVLRPGMAPPPGGWKSVDVACYRQVGHSLASLFFGLVGAFVGAIFAARRRPG